MKNSKITLGSIIVAVIAGITASLCCIAPLILLLLGVGGAWISFLTKLSFLRPFGISLTIVFLATAFWKLYISPKQDCKERQICALPNVLRFQRILFWIVTIFLILLLTFPWYAPLFYSGGGNL